MSDKSSAVVHQYTEYVSLRDQFAIAALPLAIVIAEKNRR